jgi:divalent metal cation (Fe/Co/Zn/Cd) transporter
MASGLQIPVRETIRSVQRIQTLTIVWMTVEAAVSLAAAWMARSPALLAFGGDSAIELLSAIIVLWRFRAHAALERSEKHAARIAAVLLFILGAYVAVVSALTLLGYGEPKTTYVGIAVLVAATAIMPWLAKEKRKLSAITGSAALRADAAESALCAYLSLIALVGLGVNAIWHLRWADPIAALVIVPLVLREGWEAMRGKACGCRHRLRPVRASKAETSLAEVMYMTPRITTGVASSL